MNQSKKIDVMATVSQAQSTIDAAAIDSGSVIAEAGAIELLKPTLENGPDHPSMGTLDDVGTTAPPSAAASDSQVTGLLNRWSAGDQEALDELAPLVFDQLRRIARRNLLREGRGHILQTTALVNEVFLKLLGRQSVTWCNKKQFYGFVGQQMRRTLIDHARRQNALRRGAGQQPTSLDEALNRAEDRDLDLVALDDALEDLKSIDSEASLIVELEFFVGLSHQETAEVTGLSKATVRRRWDTARAWLRRQLSKKGDSGPSATEKDE